MNESTNDIFFVVLRRDSDGVTVNPVFSFLRVFAEGFTLPPGSVRKFCFNGEVRCCDCLALKRASLRGPVYTVCFPICSRSNKG